MYYNNTNGNNYRPQKKLREGNNFHRCPSVHGGYVSCPVLTTRCHSQGMGMSGEGGVGMSNGDEYDHGGWVSQVPWYTHSLVLTPSDSHQNIYCRNAFLLHLLLRKHHMTNPSQFTVCKSWFLLSVFVFWTLDDTFLNQGDIVNNESL